VVEDGAPCHTCKLAKEARSILGIPSIILPPSSPDLNPIENVQHLLKIKLSQLVTRNTSPDMLWEQVQACWADIDKGYINKLIDGMPVRVKAVQMARDEISRFCKSELIDIMYNTLNTGFDLCALSIDEHT
jgi:hypothetical protein